MGRQSKQKQHLNLNVKTKKDTKSNHKKPWSEKQDALLTKLIQKHGPFGWSFIARGIHGRQGKQCRERWHNHLNPDIKTSEWETTQEWILFIAHKVYESRWALMSKLILGRTDNSIKNHWHSGMKKRIEQFTIILQKLIKEKKNSYLVNSSTDQYYLNLQKDLLYKILSQENIQRSQLKMNQKQDQNMQNINRDYINLFKISTQDILEPSKNSNVNQNISNIKQNQQQLQSKIMRLYSTLSEKKETFNNYSMIFETPPRQQFPRQEFQQKIQDSRDQLFVQQIQFDNNSNQLSLESPSKFIMM